ncbi:hypothetical protein ACNAW0_28860 [Micromonospora sp. SL1-18]|uniref:hypothetical protein n=1 Tax=Micromonospora sp. SL1-18 TaxID=3399128 RepID=UPI003A4D6BCD
MNVVESPEAGSSNNGPEAVAARHRAVLRRFTVRARRVEEHSLASDKQRLMKWSQGTFTLTFEAESGKAAMTWELPDEESLDSLAARCRPFLLQGDPVYHGKVTNALGFFLRAAPDELREHLQNIRDGWRPLDPADRRTLGYESRAGSLTEAFGELVTDKELAYAWLYGDLVHADDSTEDRIRGHDIDSRFQAGALFITNVAVKSIITLNLLRQAQSDGYVGLEEDVFTERVVARPQRELTLEKFATAPVGTPTADIEAVLDSIVVRPDATGAEAAL